MSDELDREIELSVTTLRCVAEFLDIQGDTNTAHECRQRADALEEANA